MCGAIGRDALGKFLYEEKRKVTLMKPFVLITVAFLLFVVGVGAVTQNPVAISLQNCSIVDLNAGSGACGDTVRLLCNVTVVGSGGTVGDEKITKVQMQVGNTVLDASCLSTSCVTLSGTKKASANALWGVNYTIGSKDSGSSSVQLTQAMAVSSSGMTCSGSGYTTTDSCYVSFDNQSIPATCSCSSSTVVGAAQKDNTALVTTTPSTGCGSTAAVTSTQFADYCDPGWVASTSVCGGVNRSIVTFEYDNVKGTMVKSYTASDGGQCCSATAQQAGHVWFNHNTGSDCDPPVDNALSVPCQLDAWPAYQRGDAAIGSTDTSLFAQQGYVKHTTSEQSLWQPLAADLNNDGNIEIVVGSASKLEVLDKNGAVKASLVKNVVAQPVIFGIFMPTSRLPGVQPVQYNAFAVTNSSLVVVPVLESGVYYVKAYSPDLATVVSSVSLGSLVPSGVSCLQDYCYVAGSLAGVVQGYKIDPVTGSSSSFDLAKEQAIVGGIYTGGWTTSVAGLSVGNRTVPVFMDDDKWNGMVIWTEYQVSIAGAYTTVSVMITDEDGNPIRRFSGLPEHFSYQDAQNHQLAYEVPGGFVYDRHDDSLYAAYQEQYLESNVTRMQLGLWRISASSGLIAPTAVVASVQAGMVFTPVWDATLRSNATEGISNVVVNDVGNPAVKLFTLSNSDPLVSQTLFSIPSTVSIMPTWNPFGTSPPSFISIDPAEDKVIVNGYGGWNFITGTLSFANTGGGVVGVDWTDHVYVAYSEHSGCGLYCATQNGNNVCSFADFSVTPVCMNFNSGHVEEICDCGVLAQQAAAWKKGSEHGIMGQLDTTWTDGLGHLHLVASGMYLVDSSWIPPGTGYNTSLYLNKTPFTSVWKGSLVPFGGGLNQIGPLYVSVDQVAGWGTPVNWPAKYIDSCRFNGNLATPRFVCDDGKKYKYNGFSSAATYTVTTASCGADFRPLVYNSDRYILGYAAKTKNTGLTSTPGPELVYCDFTNEEAPILNHLSAYLPASSWGLFTNASGNYTQWTIAAYYQRRDAGVYNNFDRVVFYGKILSGTPTMAQMNNNTLFPWLASLWAFDMTTEAPIASTVSATTRTMELRYDSATNRLYPDRGVTSAFAPRSFVTVAEIDGDGGYEIVSGKSADSLQSGVARNYSFSSVKDAWSVPVDLNGDGAVDIISVGPTDTVTTYISNPAVSALLAGPPRISALHCTVTPKSGMATIQVVGALSNPDDAQVIIDPGDGTGSYFPDVALNGQYKYEYARSGNYTIDVKLLASQNVANFSEATCSVSVDIPASAQTTAGGCSLGLDGEFSFSDDVLNHGWVYDGGVLVPSNGVVGVRSGKLLQHAIVGCDRSVQTIEVLAFVSDGDVRIISGKAQIAGVAFDTSAGVIRDMDGKSLGFTVVPGQEITVRFVVDRDKGKTFVYSGLGTLYTTYNTSGVVTGVMVRGPMTVDYVRVSQSGATIIAPVNISGTQPESGGDKMKLLGCAVSNVGGSSSLQARMSYPNVGAYCNTVDEGGTKKHCEMKQLIEAVKMAPSCSKEAYNYCVAVELPRITKSAGIENQSTTIQGATSCMVLLTGSSLWGGVVAPSASVIWSLITSNMTVMVIVIVLLVLIVPIYIKAKR